MAGDSTVDPRTLSADAQFNTRDTFVYDDATPRNDTINNFDDLSGSNFLHDKVDLTGLFDALGGTYSDGNNDLQDRINAVTLAYGDFNGDGKADTRLTIKGLSDFQINFSNPLSSYKGGFDIGSGLGIYDDIAVKSDQAAPTMPTSQIITAGNNAYLADEQHKTSDSFLIKPDATGNHTIWNFDNISADGSTHDQIDLSDLFDAIGGKYSDGVNDFADRQAALQFQTGDFNGDGQSDVRIKIQGHDNFSLTLLDPVNASGATFESAASGGGSDLILGGGSTPGTTPVPSTPTTVPSTPVPVPPTTTPTTPTTSPAGSGNGLFEGKFPAHWSRLDNGINIERSEIGKMTTAELKYLKDLGVQNVRLMLDMDDGWMKQSDTHMPTNGSYFQGIKAFMDKAIDAGLAVVLDPLASKPAYLSNPTQANIDHVATWEKDIASWVKANWKPTDVFIEPQNEPFMPHGADWWKIQGQLIDAIHSVAPDYTVVAMSNGKEVNYSQPWTFVGSMTPFSPYADKNVVYTIHDYNPTAFTWQGTFATPFTNQHWPGPNAYNMGPAQVEALLSPLHDWAQQNGVYVTVDEFGALNTMAPDEKAAYLKDMVAIYDKFGWGWDVWELNKGFGITNSYTDLTIQDRFLKALGLGAYQDASSHDWTGTGTTSTTPTPPTPPSTGSGSTFTADSSFSIGEKITVAATDVNKTVTINNFDSVSGSPAGIKDQVDLTAVLHAVGIDDWNARKAALHLTSVDLNHDGHMDLQLTIDGAPNFHLNFISPNNADVTAFDIGSGHGVYDNILIA